MLCGGHFPVNYNNILFGLFLQLFYLCYFSLRFFRYFDFLAVRYVCISVFYFPPSVFTSCLVLLEFHANAWLFADYRDKAPGQRECDEAIEVLNNCIREVDQASLAAISQQLTPRDDISHEVCVISAEYTPSYILGKSTKKKIPTRHKLYFGNFQKELLIVFMHVICVITCYNSRLISISSNLVENMLFVISGSAWADGSLCPGD